MNGGIGVGVYPALVGLVYTFLVMGIIILTVYLYNKYVLNRKQTLPSTPRGEEVSPQTTSSTLKNQYPPEEVVVAAAVVKHHIALKASRSLKPLTHVYQPLHQSAWVINWIKEATQTFEYNPYVKTK